MKWQKNFHAISCALLVLSGTVVRSAFATPSNEIQLEQPQPASQEATPGSGMIPSAILGEKEFNDFNYELKAYTNPKPVPDLANISFEPTPFQSASRVQAESKPPAGSTYHQTSANTAAHHWTDHIKTAPAANATATIEPAASITAVSPEYEADNPTEITITFSKNMISEKGMEAGKETPVVSPPITINPFIPGSWRWFNRRILTFTPTAGRFPRSTEFTVTVPKSLEAENHQNLATEKSWKFTTARPFCNQVYGGYSHLGLSIPLQFNQPVKLQSLLSKTHMTVEGLSIPLRAATKEEGRSLLGQFIDKEGAYCLMPAADLPQGSNGMITVDPGVEGTEGPLFSVNGFEQSFHTQQKHFECTSPQLVTASPGQPWILKFIGPLNLKTGSVFQPGALKPEMFAIAPPLTLQKITASNDSIFIRGLPVPDQKYTLTVRADLPGAAAPLGKDIEFELVSRETGTPEVFPLTSSAYVVTPLGATNISIFSRSTTELIATIYDAEKLFPDRIPTAGSLPYDLDKYTPLLQKRLSCIPFAGNIKVSNLDLSSLRRAKNKQFILVAAPAKESSTSKTAAWIQFVSTNVTSLTSNSSSRVLCTNLKTGKMEEAQSAIELPNTQFDKVGKGQFTLRSKLRPQQSALRVVAKNEKVYLPNESSRLHSPDLAYKVEKIAVFCTGDLEHTHPSEMTRFAGFLSTQDISGKKCCAPNGEITFIADDSAGNLLGSGTIEVTDGVFSGQLSIPKEAKTGVGKIKFAYKSSVNLDALNFSAELRILPLLAQNKAHFQCEPAITPHGLTASGKIKVRSRFDEHNALYPEAKPYWSVYTRFADYHPQGWNDFDFGHHRDGIWGDQFSEPPPEQNKHDSITFTYDNRCSMPINIRVFTFRNSLPNKLEREDHSFIIQPADLLVGVKAKSDCHQGSTLIDLEGIVTDHTGVTAAGKPVEIKILKDIGAKNDWENVPLLSQTFISSNSPTKLNLEVKDDAKLLLLATVTDGNNKISRTILDICPEKISSKPSNAAPIRVSTHKRAYHPGEKCILNLDQPFEQSSGFGAFSTESSIESFLIDKNTADKEVSFLIPKNAVGKLSGIIKLFGTKTAAENYGEAEGQFELNVEPFVQAIRVSLSCDKAATQELETQKLSVQVLDENSNPVPGASVILTGAYDGHDADFRDEDFNFLMSNPRKTALYASSLTRGPTLSTTADERKPISEQPGILTNEKQSDRALKRITKYASTEGVFPLQLLKTDDHGTAEFNTNLGNLRDNAVIKAFVMTKSGSGFGSTSIILPGKSSIFTDDKARAAQGTQSAEPSTTTMDQQFDNLGLLNSEVLSLKDQKSIVNYNTQRTAPIALSISNSMLTSLASSAERLLLQHPATSDQHAARLITLLSLLPFLNDPGTARRYEETIEADTRVMESLNDFSLSHEMSWIPQSKARISVFNKFEPPFVVPLLAQSLLMSKERGFYEWPEIESCRTELLTRNLGSQQYSDAAEEQKAIAYAGYVGFQIHKFMDFPPLSWMYKVTQLGSDTKIVQKHSAETIAWLIPYRTHMEFSQPVIKALESKFTELVDKEISEQSREIVHEPHKLRLLSAMLIAQLSLNDKSNKANLLAKSIDERMKMPECVYDDIDRAFACMALTQFYDRFHSSDLAAATVKIKDREEHFQFPANSILIQSLKVPRDSDSIELKGTAGLTCELVEKLKDEIEKPAVKGIAIKRTFKPLRNSDETFVDGQSNLHCKVGSILVEKIQFVPAKTLDHIVVTEPTQLDSTRVGALPAASQSAAQFKTGNYKSTWPQAITTDENHLRVYGSDIRPGEYEFIFQRTFPKLGKFKLPAAYVESPYDHSVFGISSGQTIIVDP
ncbi:MAG: hypothetical protein U0103_25550 [Candidatus Obscuribacterales bacterium]